MFLIVVGQFVPQQKRDGRFRLRAEGFTNVEGFFAEVNGVFAVVHFRYRFLLGDVKGGHGVAEIAACFA